MVAVHNDHDAKCLLVVEHERRIVPPLWPFPSTSLGGELRGKSGLSHYDFMRVFARAKLFDTRVKLWRIGAMRMAVLQLPKFPRTVYIGRRLAIAALGLGAASRPYYEWRDGVTIVPADGGDDEFWYNLTKELS